MKDAGRQNPFNELYLTEAIEDPALYLQWFSPRILTGETAALFRKGNTVLRGSNGAGKTMLLRLFAPDVRAFHLSGRSGVRWDIPMEQALGINVNFIHAGFGNLGARRLTADRQDSRAQWPFVVGDLLNYWLTHQLLVTLEFINDTGSDFAQRIGATVTTDALNEFARVFARNDCWFGYLTTVRTFDELGQKVRKRIEAYRSFVNWNTSRLATDITRTKTEVGTPLQEARLELMRLGILPDAIPLVVTLDQYETLYHTDYALGDDDDSSLGRDFCRVVNTLLASRRASISYKIGVRPYAWGRELRALNTEARLEHGRDYQLVDLDEVLRRPENPRTWIFPKFAADVAARRIGGSGEANRPGASWLEGMLENLQPDEEIERYCHDTPDRLEPKPEESWPEEWKTCLANLYTTSKYKARLAEIWMRQAAGRRSGSVDLRPAKGGRMPWERVWWQKERRDAVLTQLASACSQRRLYCGWTTLLTLSSPNILVFISLCREVWDHWERARSDPRGSNDRMSADVQSQAIRMVANRWLEKQDESPRGTTRRRFVVRLGVALRKALIGDRTLSYPGHTGFSLTEDDLAADRQMRCFLEDAVDYGALVCLPHTSKTRDGRRRRKWYLSPILCPNFEIPAIRTKEPYYATGTEVQGWILGKEIVIRMKERSTVGASGDKRRLF